MGAHAVGRLGERKGLDLPQGARQKRTSSLAQVKPHGLRCSGPGHSRSILRLNLYRVLQYQKKGAPVEWLRTDPVLAKATPMLIAERAPHPNTALLFANWFTSLEGQQTFTDVTGRLFQTAGLKARRQTR